MTHDPNNKDCPLNETMSVIGLTKDRDKLVCTCKQTAADKVYENWCAIAGTRQAKIDRLTAELELLKERDEAILALEGSEGMTDAKFAKWALLALQGSMEMPKQTATNRLPEIRARHIKRRKAQAAALKDQRRILVDVTSIYVEVQDDDIADLLSIIDDLDKELEQVKADHAELIQKAKVCDDLAEWSCAHPRGRIYSPSKQPDMDAQLIALENRAKELQGSKE